MKFSTLKITLVIAALMLMLAGVASFLVGAPSAQTTPPPNTAVIAPTATPEASPETSQTPITPLVTLTLPPTATPTPTPTAVPTATPVPTPPARELGSGSFRSDTGVPINLVCSWSAKASSSDTAQLTITVALESYSLFINAKADALRYTVDGNTASATVAAINTDTTTPILTELGEKSFTVNIKDGETLTIPVVVEWLFEGVYSKVTLETVTASSNITISR